MLVGVTSANLRSYDSALTVIMRVVIDGLERIWKEAIVALSKYRPGTCLVGLRERGNDEYLWIAGVPAKSRRWHL